MEHRSPAIAAPWENPRIPSNGPNVFHVSRIRSRLFLNPLSQSETKLARKKSSSRLNHQPFCSWNSDHQMRCIKSKKKYFGTKTQIGLFFQIFKDIVCTEFPFTDVSESSRGGTGCGAVINLNSADFPTIFRNAPSLSRNMTSFWR